MAVMVWIVLQQESRDVWPVAAFASLEAAQAAYPPVEGECWRHESVWAEPKGDDWWANTAHGEIVLVGFDLQGEGL